MNNIPKDVDRYDELIQLLERKSPRKSISKKKLANIRDEREEKLATEDEEYAYLKDMIANSEGYHIRREDMEHPETIKVKKMSELQQPISRKRAPPIKFGKQKKSQTKRQEAENAKIAAFFLDFVEAFHEENTIDQEVIDNMTQILKDFGEENGVNTPRHMFFTKFMKQLPPQLYFDFVIYFLNLHYTYNDDYKIEIIFENYMKDILTRRAIKYFMAKEELKQIEYEKQQELDRRKKVIEQQEQQEREGQQIYMNDNPDIADVVVQAMEQAEKDKLEMNRKLKELEAPIGLMEEGEHIPVNKNYEKELQKILEEEDVQIVNTKAKKRANLIENGEIVEQTKIKRPTDYPYKETANYSALKCMFLFENAPWLGDTSRLYIIYIANGSEGDALEKFGLPDNSFEYDAKIWQKPNTVLWEKICAKLYDYDSKTNEFIVKDFTKTGKITENTRFRLGYKIRPTAASYHKTNDVNNVILHDFNVHRAMVNYMEIRNDIRSYLNDKISSEAKAAAKTLLENSLSSDEKTLTFIDELVDNISSEYTREGKKVDDFFKEIAKCVTLNEISEQVGGDIFKQDVISGKYTVDAYMLVNIDRVLEEIHAKPETIVSMKAHYKHLLDENILNLLNTMHQIIHPSDIVKKRDTYMVKPYIKALLNKYEIQRHPDEVDYNKDKQRLIDVEPEETEEPKLIPTLMDEVNLYLTLCEQNLEKGNTKCTQQPLDNGMSPMDEDTETDTDTNTDTDTDTNTDTDTDTDSGDDDKNVRAKTTNNYSKQDDKDENKDEDKDDDNMNTASSDTDTSDDEFLNIKEKDKDKNSDSEKKENKKTDDKIKCNICSKQISNDDKIYKTKIKDKNGSYSTLNFCSIDCFDKYDM